MDNSTDEVKLLIVFLKDVLNEVEKLKVDTAPLLTIAAEYDLSNLYHFVPITIYNEMCAWVEKNLGEDAIIQVGKNIGETVYSALIDNHVIEADSMPINIIEGLTIAAASMIKDAKERGWEILDTTNTFILMRRTQTFNSKLQFGLLEGLLSKCLYIKDINISYTKEVVKGDDFDEYLIRWVNK